MDRLSFLKTTGLTLTGLSSGLVNPLSLIQKDSEFIINQNNFLPYEEEYVDKNSEQWQFWLGRLVISALVSSLIAKVVDRMLPEPVCTGSSCPIKKATYQNTNGIYGYPNVKPRFYKQEIVDSSVSFQNISVPFITYNQKNCGAVYQEIIKVEGPNLAGLCKLSNHLQTQYNIDQVRNVIVPTSGIKDAGYRFDRADCDGNSTTKFNTKYGSTELTYNINTKNVNARVRNNFDRLDFEQDYLLNEV